MTTNPWTRWGSRLLTLVASGGLAACFAVTDLDRFGAEDPAAACDGGDLDEARDLDVRLIDFEPAADRLLAIRIVDDRSVVQSRVVVEDLELDGLDENRIFVPDVIPPGAHRIDMFVDDDADGAYGGATVDRSWREPLCASGLFEFTYNEMFQDISDPPTMNVGQPFTLLFRQMTPHTAGTQKLELIVKEVEGDLTVGFYRIPDVDEPDFTVGIPGIIIPGKQYRIDFYADLNQNGEYDDPPVDHTWRVEATGTTDGLDTTFIHNTDFVPVGDSFD